MLALAFLVAQSDVSKSPDGVGFVGTMRGVIDAPIERVNKVVGEPWLYPTWIPSIKSVSKRDDIYEVLWKFVWPIGEVRQVLQFASADADGDIIYTWRQLSGEMIRHDGTWRLRKTDDGKTYVEYTVAVALKTWVPDWLIMRTQHRALPAFFKRLQTRTDQP